MSDLRARARDIAAKLVWDNHGHYAMPRQDDITDAILRGMVEALEAEPDEGMRREAEKLPEVFSMGDEFSAMAAERAKGLK